jgi:hypothetical protein
MRRWFAIHSTGKRSGRTTPMLIMTIMHPSPTSPHHPTLGNRRAGQIFSVTYIKR